MKVLICTILAIFWLSSSVMGEIVTREIEYTHGDTRLKGILAYDDAIEGQRPGVVVVHEWWGRNDYVVRRARELAELGYAAFAIDMYGDGRTTNDPQQAGEWASQYRGENGELGRQRALAGIETLRAQPEVDNQKIAIMGYCFGGTIALEVARSGADIDAAISFHGGLATAQPAQKGQVKASILVLHGAADPLVSQEEIAAMQKEFDEAGADWVFVAYSGAVHSFTSPEADQHGIEGIAYHEKADKRSWQAMKAFLEEAFGANARSSLRRE